MSRPINGRAEAQAGVENRESPEPEKEAPEMLDSLGLSAFLSQ